MRVKERLVGRRRGAYNGSMRPVPCLFFLTLACGPAGDGALRDQQYGGAAGDPAPADDGGGTGGGEEAVDADGDGVLSTADCDDTDALRYPYAPEWCNELDDDCDGFVDEEARDAQRSYADLDGDGAGDSSTVVEACGVAEGRVTRGADCDDTDPARSPAFTEVCNFIDDDCNTLIDDDDPGVTGTSLWYPDADADGYGDGSARTWACVAPVGALTTSGDCDDADFRDHPGGVETCNDDDEDCDGVVDNLAEGDCAAIPEDTGASSSTAVRFLVVGDTGTGTPGQYSVADGMVEVCAREGCDFILLVGDNFYPDGVTSTTDSQWTTAFESPYSDIDVQFWAVMGNHDWGHSTDPAFLTPQVDYTAVSSKWYMPADYYTRVQGDITFFGIDTHLIDQGEGAAQEAWLPVERAASTTTWNLIYGHHPYISNGPHGDAGVEVEAFFNDHVCGQFDVYFCGHDHNLQWLEERCGTSFFVSGAGQSTYPLFGTNPVYFEEASLGFLWVEIDGNTLTGVFYDETATELYRGTLTK